MLLLACERLKVIANETPEYITIHVGMLDRACAVQVRPLHYLLEVETCVFATLFARGVDCPNKSTIVVILAYLPPLSSSCLAMQLPI